MFGSSHCTDTPIGATLRVVVEHFLGHDDAVVLDLVTHDDRPDPDGLIPGDDIVLLKRAAVFARDRGVLVSVEPFRFQLSSDDRLPRYMSARAADGTVIAIGEVRVGRGNYTSGWLRAAAGTIELKHHRRD